VVIQLIAITDDASTPPPPLRAVACGELTAICAPADDAAGGAESLWRHEELVESLMATRDLLPVRFGTMLTDADAVADAVGQRGVQLAGQLERVRGAVELAVRVEERLPAELPAESSASGAEYLRARADRARAGRVVHEALAAISRDSTTLLGPELLRGAYLVERSAVERFVEHVRSLQAEHTALDLICTGPWPPYSFAERTR
jgi:hypothetical protein